MIREHYDLSMGDQTLCITSIHLVESLDESLVERNSDQMQRSLISLKGLVHNSIDVEILYSRYDEDMRFNNLSVKLSNF